MTDLNDTNNDFWMTSNSIYSNSKYHEIYTYASISKSGKFLRSTKNVF